MNKNLALILAATSWGLFTVGSVKAQPVPPPTAEPAPRAEAAKPATAPADAPPAEPAPAAPPGNAVPTEAPAVPNPDKTGTATPAAAASAEPMPTAPVSGTPASTPPPVASSPTASSNGDKAAAASKGGADSDTAQGKAAVYAEEWWTHARPIFEFHGYFRLRWEMFNNFYLGRADSPDGSIWPRPADSFYAVDSNTSFGANQLCNREESDSNGPVDSESGLVPCDGETTAGANMRFRLNPEVHVSDNLRVVSQIDILDNVVLGSTPEGSAFGPSASGGYESLARSGYTPIGLLDNTAVPPSAGQNSVEDSIRVKRVWGEYSTPVGQLRFGRMPNHWGLGMVMNAGDGHDDDAQSTIDRLMFASTLKPLDLTIAGAWDFPNEGLTKSSATTGNPAYDRAQGDDVDQYTLILLRQKSQELEKLFLTRGNVIVNGGLNLSYRRQMLDSVSANTPDLTGADASNSFARRDANMWVPDLWLQVLYKKFRFESELAMVYGTIGSTEMTADNGGDFGATSTTERKLRQYGLVTEFEQKLVEDRLRLRFNFGWSSGDPDAHDPNTAGDLAPGPNETQINDDTISTFRFHPSYRVDLLLHRNLLQRVQGTYYFKPSLDYDFMREASGQRLGGQVGVIWSRASEYMQSPGNDRDLGLEIDAALFFQSKDGANNDDPDEYGGFYSKLEYGVLFPLAGMGYPNGAPPDTSAAQILRLYLGVIF
ncbi:MAG: TIGR04551 family protein [Polyangiaceae bacterium]|nr:TIGR04551 family protein [Polyangiaceae bacterium]